MVNPAASTRVSDYGIPRILLVHERMNIERSLAYQGTCQRGNLSGQLQ